MKTHIKLFTFFFSLGAFAGSLLGAENFQLSIPTVTADAEYVLGGSSDSVLKLGATRDEVLAKIGEPVVKINADNWAYLNVSVDKPARLKADQDTLVIAFKNGKVSDMYLVKRPMLDGLVAEARRQPKGFAVGTILARNR